METHIFLIIGIIGAITLISLFVYWKIYDFIIWQKSEINNLKSQNYKLIEAINNHADCIDIKESVKFIRTNDNSSFGRVIEPISPLRIDKNEPDRDNKQLS